MSFLFSIFDSSLLKNISPNPITVGIVAGIHSPVFMKIAMPSTIPAIPRMIVSTPIICFGGFG